ncbi:MAG: hypothetical protein O3C23_02400 [bacterium]|nr:hypothetical protein [bacterium]
MISFLTAHPTRAALLLGIFLAGLLLLYIFQINALTTQVYRMGDQEKHLVQLKEQGVHLDVQHLGSFTRTRMEELAKEMQFERVGKISYLKILSSSVATTINQE